MGPFLQVQLGTTEALASMFTLVWSVFYAMGQGICKKVRWKGGTGIMLTTQVPGLRIVQGGGTFGKIVRVLRTCKLNSDCITCIISVYSWYVRVSQKGPGG